MTTALLNKEDIQEKVKTAGFPNTSNVVSVMEYEGREVILVSFEKNKEN